MKYHWYFRYHFTAVTTCHFIGAVIGIWRIHINSYPQLVNSEIVFTIYISIFPVWCICLIMTGWQDQSLLGIRCSQIIIIWPYLRNAICDTWSNTGISSSSVYLLYIRTRSFCHVHPDNKVHGANMGPAWVLPAPDGPHACPMNFAIRVPHVQASL